MKTVKKAVPKLSKKSNHLIDCLDDSAQRRGEIGGLSFAHQTRHKNSLKELQDHVMKMEKKIKILASKNIDTILKKKS